MRRRGPLHDKLNAIETELLERIEPAPGTVQLIEALRRRGSRIGILTRNTRDVATRTLECLGVGGYFPEECILGRGEAPPKPDPEGLFRLSVRWKTVPAEMVMVGDYLFDLQTGRNAGAATIHVDRTRSFLWPELTDIGVQYAGGTSADVAGLNFKDSPSESVTGNKGSPLSTQQFCQKPLDRQGRHPYPHRT